MKNLIVNADDFGLTKGVNKAIVKAYQHGIVKSTTIMTNMPYAAEAVEVSRECPELGFGVHITLDAGKAVRPVEDVSSLVDEEGNLKGNFLDFYNDVDPIEVRREIKAQIEKVLSFGIEITHLDSHHHVQEHPVVISAFLDLAEEYKLPVRSVFLRDVVSKLALKTPDKFRSDFYGKGVSQNNLEDIIINLEDGVTEIMTHPAVLDDRLFNVSSYNQRREEELGLLTGKRIIQLIKDKNINLTNYSVFK